MGHTPHMLAYAPNRAGLSLSSDGACPRPADTNATPFKRFLNLLYFESCFDHLSCVLRLTVLSLRVLGLSCYILERQLYTREKPRVFGLRMISERPRAHDLRMTLSI